MLIIIATNLHETLQKKKFRDDRALVQGIWGLMYNVGHLLGTNDTVVSLSIQHVVYT